MVRTLSEGKFDADNTVLPTVPAFVLQVKSMVSSFQKKQHFQTLGRLAKNTTTLDASLSFHWRSYGSLFQSLSSEARMFGDADVRKIRTHR